MTTGRTTASPRLPVLAVALVAVWGCGGLPLPNATPGRDGGSDKSQSTRDSVHAFDPDAPDAELAPDEPALVGAPLLFAPTAHSFGIHVVATGDPARLRARFHGAGTADWGPAVPATSRTNDSAQWSFEGLSPGQRYEYEILTGGAFDGGQQRLYQGSVVTQRKAGESFTFGLLTDSHIGADLSYSNQGTPEVLAAVAAELGAAAPDFMIHLGDMLDFHQYGFNDPPPDGTVTRQAYLNYRVLLGDTLGRASHFATIGNWEGENGCYTGDEIEISRQQRLLYVPGPKPTTYPEGGSPAEDYYAFTWGDALFIVLNVMSYTPTAHLLSMDPGRPDDWTLGPDQLGWLSTTLANAKAKWRFLFIHHAVGGKAGNDDDSAYGRGGGQAADVGEQAIVHQLMLQHGVQIFFYGHDHVFAEMVVDGIHYSAAGNAGAPWMFGPSQTGYTQSWLEYGWTKVTVSPGRVGVQFVKQGGDVLYEYSVP